MTKPEEKITAIGICNYGSVKNIKDFQRSENMEQRNNSSTIENQAYVSIIRKILY